MKQKEIKGLKAFFFSANLTLLLVIILFFLTISLIRQTILYISISKQVKELKEEIKNLEKKNLELSGSLKYLNSKFYQEREARLKFGLQKPGERVVIITPAKVQQESEVFSLKKEEPNFIKWWKYFIK